MAQPLWKTAQQFPEVLLCDWGCSSIHSGETEAFIIQRCAPNVLCRWSPRTNVWAPPTQPRCPAAGARSGTRGLSRGGYRLVIKRSEAPMHGERQKHPPGARHGGPHVSSSTYTKHSAKANIKARGRLVVAGATVGRYWGERLSKTGLC